MITVNNVSKSFNGRVVLKNISAVFEKGKTNLIIGQSGSGKTVLLKSIVGLHDVDEGEIFYNDVLFNKLNFRDKKAIRQKIGMLFQGGALFDSSTVEENVMYPMDMFTSWTKDEKRYRANQCLKRVNIINSNHLYPAEISGGMKKRVAIARAIALNPEFLFCDEPNSGLDPKTSIVIDHLIKEITEEYNITTIVNTHDMNSVMSMGDKIVFIFEGEKWWEGTKEDVLNSDNRELNNFVFASALTRKIKGIL
jgi:phospholipid/cholesterol/gamma-HCH transport system ATP-binding protein